MKPPFTYFGGKTSIADQIVRLLPPHEHTQGRGGQPRQRTGWRAGNAHDRSRTEVLWSNRPFPHQQADLFDDLAATVPPLVT